MLRTEYLEPILFITDHCLPWECVSGGLSIPGASFPGGRYNLSSKIRSESEASNLEALDPVIGKVKSVRRHEGCQTVRIAV